MSDLKRVAFATIPSSAPSSTDCAAASGVGGGVLFTSGTSSITASGSATSAISRKQQQSLLLQGNAAGRALLSASTSPSSAMFPLSSSSQHHSLQAGSTASSSGQPSSGATGLAGQAGTIAAPSASTTSQPKNSSKTFRLDLELFEPNEYSSPEFNFTKLVHVEKKKLKSTSKVNGFSDPFEDNDDDVARIAKEFEKKYGGSSNSTKGRRRKDDYYDIGAGYDATDTFIDDTEAYDEIMPKEVETVKGGFYINCGALEFNVLSNFERPDDAIKMPKSKKRALSTSSSGSDDEVEESKDADIVMESRNSPPKDNPALVASNKIRNGHSEKKSKVDGVDKESNQLIKAAKQKDKKPEKTKPKDDLIMEKDNEDVNMDGGSSGKIKEKEKTVKTTTVKDMLKAKRDNFFKMQEADGQVKLSNGENVKNDDTSDSSEDSSADSDSDNEPSEKKIKKSTSDDRDPNKLRTHDVKLPLDHTDDIINDIEELKEYGKVMTQGGKPFQFDEKITDIFLKIVDFCSCLEKPIRNQIYAHIEYQLSLPKYCLLRKAKPLRIKQEKLKTKKAFMKLKKAVSEVMPSILQAYDMNYKKVDDIRNLMALSELEKPEPLPKYPKKKFPWNDSLRNLLYELYQVRWTSYAVLGTENEPFSEFVDKYLREKVVAIWPPSWMRYEDLQKELEKRKTSANKPKENKKPGDSSTSSSKKKSGDEKVKSSSSSDMAKSVLSSNNSVSIVSTKNLVVTISTRGDKKTEVPNGSEQQPSNSLSITKIQSDDEKAESISHKSVKPISISRSTSNSPLPALNQNHTGGHPSTVVKGSSSSSTSSGGNDNSSSRHLKNDSKNNRSENSNTQINSSSSNSSSNNVNIINNSSPTSSARGGGACGSGGAGDYGSSGKNSSGASSDGVSPTKRATDHSITSLLAPLTPTSSTLPTQHSTSAGSTSTQQQQQQKTTSTSSSSGKNSASTGSVTTKTTTQSTADTAKTHIIDVDNLKNISEIINTTNQLLNSSTGKDNSSGNLLKTIGAGGGGGNGGAGTPKEGTIRIRSVANVNSSLEVEHHNTEMIISASKSLSSNTSTKPVIIDVDASDLGDRADTGSSSESDGVEIVGVFPVTNKNSTNITISKNKYKKSMSDNGSDRSSSPSYATQNLFIKTNHHKSKGSSNSVIKEEFRRDAERVLIASAANEVKDTELDVNQIMKALKELEEMRQSSIHIPGDSPTQNRSSGSSSQESPIFITSPSLKKPSSS